MKDFFLFRRMLTPMLLQLLFWLTVLGCIVTSISNFINGDIMRGLQILILGPIIARIGAEVLILFFRMNETLTDIKNK